MSHVETGVDSQSHATSLADCIHLMPRVRRRISSSGRQLAVRNCDVSATTGCRTWGGRTPPHASDMSRAGGACSLHPLSNMQQRAGRGRSCLGCGQGGRRQWLMVTHAGTWAYVTRETGQRLHGTSTCRCTVGSWLYIIWGCNGGQTRSTMLSFCRRSDGSSGGLYRGSDKICLIVDFGIGVLLCPRVGQMGDEIHEVHAHGPGSHAIHLAVAGQTPVMFVPCQALWGVVLFPFTQKRVAELQELCVVGLPVNHISQDVQRLVQRVNQAAVGVVHHLLHFTSQLLQGILHVVALGLASHDRCIGLVQLNVLDNGRQLLELALNPVLVRLAVLQALDLPLQLLKHLQNALQRLTVHPSGAHRRRDGGHARPRLQHRLDVLQLRAHADHCISTRLVRK
mmetsp:Transcript_18544/g.32222  ORF Transcript_18544/g.32222 Transcript_18544/m.32222 type:complete len:396 (-) Transcript_18544:3036-4223(-)